MVSLPLFWPAGPIRRCRRRAKLFSRAVSPTPVDQGWSLRRAQREDYGAIARVQTDGWRDSFRGLMPDSVLDGPLLDDHRVLWRRMLGARGGGFGDMGFPWLAVGPTGKVIGFSAFGPVRGSSWEHDAEIYALYVDTEWRGHGIGRALVRQTAQGLMAQHRRSLLLWALEDNSKARAFYDRIGGKVIDREAHCFGGVWLPEVAYEWRDMALLLE